MLNTQEKYRYKRHLNLPQFGIQGQKKLKAASVLVIGTGGLGAPVLNYLTAAGLGTIGIIDADVVDETNLQRQVLFNSTQIGEKKVECAKERLANLNPNVRFKTWDVYYQKENAQEITSGFDVVVNCSDNYETRYLSDEICALNNIPLVMGSIHNYEGQVSVFNYKGGPRYCQAFPTAPDKSLFNENDLGVLGVLPSVTGSLQASEAIKVITEIGEVLSGQLLVFSLWDNSFQKFKI